MPQLKALVEDEEDRIVVNQGSETVDDQCLTLIVPETKIYQLVVCK